MANLENHTVDILSLPRDVRDIIYGDVLHSSCLAHHYVWVGGQGSRFYYKIGSAKRPKCQGHCPRLTIDLLLVNHQIHNEASEVLQSTPLLLLINLNIARVDFEALHPELTQAYHFIPGGFGRLHSTFGNMRHLHVGFNSQPFEGEPVHEKVHSTCRLDVISHIGSLLPPYPQRNFPALRSLTAWIEISGFHIGASEVEHCFEWLQGFIAFDSIIVDVSLECWFTPKDNSTEEKEARSRFGDWLTEEFARRRAAYIKQMMEAEIEASQERTTDEIDEDEKEDDVIEEGEDCNGEDKGGYDVDDEEDGEME